MAFPQGRALSQAGNGEPLMLPPSLLVPPSHEQPGSVQALRASRFSVLRMVVDSSPSARLDEHREKWSFQACFILLPTSSLDQSKRARVKEHRLSKNTIGLVCRLPRAQGLTRLLLPLWCARSASKGDEQPPFGVLPSASTRTAQAGPSSLFGPEHFRDKTIGVTGSQIRVGIIRAGIVIRACRETRQLVSAG